MLDELEEEKIVLRLAGAFIREYKIKADRVRISISSYGRIM